MLKKDGNRFYLKSGYKSLIVNLIIKVYGLGFNIKPFEVSEMNCIFLDITLFFSEL